MLGLLSPTHIILLLAAVCLLFGSSRIAGSMGELAKGIKLFKRTMNESEPPSALPTITAPLPKLDHGIPASVDRRPADYVDR